MLLKSVWCLNIAKHRALFDCSKSKQTCLYINSFAVILYWIRGSHSIKIRVDTESSICLFFKIGRHLFGYEVIFKRDCNFKALHFVKVFSQSCVCKCLNTPDSVLSVFTNVNQYWLSKQPLHKQFLQMSKRPEWANKYFKLKMKLT